jgi:hypothetical protein
MLIWQLFCGLNLSPFVTTSWHGFPYWYPTVFRHPPHCLHGSLIGLSLTLLAHFLALMSQCDLTQKVSLAPSLSLAFSRALACLS